MDYKKKYEEVLERAKEIIECSKQKDSKEVRMVLSFFPELAESEDERIRKEIKQFIRSRGMSLAQSKVDSWIAWLEKQGEPTNIPADAVLDSNKDGLIADTIQSKPKFKVGDKIYLKPEYRMPDDDTPIANTVKEIRRIDDKYYRFDRSYIFIEDQDKYELVEQKPAAWSDDELDSITAAINNLEYLKNNYAYHQMELEPAITFLKSLKERYTWKPSDEQMEVLMWCKPLFTDPKSKGILESLINDLKNL